jgi:hypothetical protein
MVAPVLPCEANGGWSWSTGPKSRLAGRKWEGPPQGECAWGSAPLAAAPLWREAHLADRCKRLL